MSAPLLVLAAGGTGGHMFPAQALAEEMLGRGWRVRLTSDARGLRYSDSFPEAVERVETRAASLARGGLTGRLGAPVTILRGVVATIAAFERDRPAVIAGFGGYPSVPALAAGWWLRIPRLIHEQNAVLGRVNRVFAMRVDRVLCGAWPTARLPGGVSAEHVGNPVRAAVQELAEQPYQPPGEGRLRLVVFGGSQGASVLARVVPQAIQLLPEEVRCRLEVVQQARPGEEETLAAAYRDSGVTAEIAPFFDDMPGRIADAHLVISRAGASTVAEIAAIGRPAVLVPYPHATDDHQTANAAALARAGGAVAVQERELTAEWLSRQLRAVLLDPACAADMAAAARSAARPDAARRLADIVEDLAA